MHSQELILKIYDTIKNYYPIGLSFESPLYQNSKYRNLLLKKCKEKTNIKDYQYWKEFSLLEEKHIGKFNDTIIGTLEPSYSGFYEINKTDFGDFSIWQTFHVRLSTLGPFFCMYGQDKIIIKNSERRKFRPTVIASPMDMYTTIFKRVEKAFSHYYPNHHYVPFRILKMKIKGLDIGDYVNKEYSTSTTYQALFHQADIYYNHVVGDISYGLNLNS